MTRKKTILIVAIIIMTMCTYLLYDNILILDDIHTVAYDNTENAAFIEDSSLDDGSEPDIQTSTFNPPAKGYHIHINLDEVKMYVYKNAELVKTYPVSGGKPSTPTPLGTWKIISKDTWGEGFGGAWMGFNVPWGKYGIHGTVYPWFIGKSNSSKGCIRMNNKDVRELYKLVPYGTTVSIVHNSPVFRTIKSGDIGSDVLLMQKSLKTLGFFNGYCDGKYGSLLRSSVIKFQKAYKLYGSGVINKSTYNLILQKAKEKEQPSPTPQPTIAPTAEASNS